MAKISKEQKLYTEGMEHALRIAKQEGVEGLEREVRYRNTYPIPLHVSRSDITTLARAEAHEELMIVATAMATAMTFWLKLPPSTILEYLKEFNRNIEVFRYDTEALKEAQQKLDKARVLNETIRNFKEKENIYE